VPGGTKLPISPSEWLTSLGEKAQAALVALKAPLTKPPSAS
jgi:hypothetical protein